MNIKFGTDGWRAIMAEDFTFDNVKIVSQAIANYHLKSNKPNIPLIVGHDTRFFAEEFSNLILGVLAGNGIKAIKFSRPMPTPITAFSIKKLKAGGAFMLTASHNPPGYNGIKFIPEYAGPAFPDITAQIEVEINNVIESDGVNFSTDGAEQAEIYEPFNDYHDSISKLIDFNKFESTRLTIGVDPLYGAGQGIISRLLMEAGVNVISIHEYRDVLFGGSLPDPSKENLKELAKLVVEKNMALGLALDGDADRFAAVDSNGKYFAPNQIIPMIMKFLLEQKNLTGKAVRTVATTHLIDRIASKYNLSLVEVPVGFKYICKEMLEDDVLIGGEESGGLSVKGHIPEKDGILAGLLLAEIATHYNIGEYLEAMYEEFGFFKSTRIDLEMEEEEKNQLLQNLKNEPPSTIANFKVEETQNIDGYKYILDNGDWFLARPSGTEPIIRIYIESTDNQRFEELCIYANNLVEAIH